MDSLSKFLGLNVVRSLKRLSPVKDLADFLQRHAPSLGESEIDNGEPHHQGADEHYIVLPTYGIQSYRIDEPVEDATAVLRQIEDGKALGAERIRQHLEQVGDWQGVHGEVVKGVEYEHHNHHADTKSFIVEPLLLIFRRNGSPDDESDQHADVRREEHEPPTEAVDEDGGGGGNGKVVNLHATIDEILRFGVFDADAAEHESKIRRDKPVTAPLDEEAKNGSYKQPMTVCLYELTIGISMASQPERRRRAWNLLVCRN